MTEAEINQIRLDGQFWRVLPGGNEKIIAFQVSGLPKGIIASLHCLKDSWQFYVEAGDQQEAQSEFENEHAALEGLREWLRHNAAYRNGQLGKGLNNRK